MEYTNFMYEALEEAAKAYEMNEVPIGAVITHKGIIIARAHNKREVDNNPIAHAEVEAMQIAAEALGTWNLSECTLYVTVEPCPMCAGTILQTQMSTVVYGCSEPNSGSFGSVIDLSKEAFNHKPKIIKGILEEECKRLMQDFFKEKRKSMVKVKKLDQSDLKDYHLIREAVFVIEQNVSIDLEYDDYDEQDRRDVTHVGAFIDSKMVGTMRLISKGKTLVVGRLAVLKEHRKDGVGNALLKYAQTQAENNGFEVMELGAQLTAIPFYVKSGYQEYGEVFMDANIEHKMMNKIVNKR